MSVATTSKSFPAPQLRTTRGVGSTESIPQLYRSTRGLLHSDGGRRLGALMAFAIAVLIVLVSASGAMAQIDSDNDGIGDEVERTVYGTDPNNGDSDFDGLPDGVEISLGTNPLDADSDGDGASDAEEYLSGGDPLVPTFEPVAVAVTPVPVTVAAGSETPATTSVQAPVSVTVTPEGFNPAPASLAFTTIPSDRSPLVPLYILIASAIGVGMLELVRRIPPMGQGRGNS